MMKTSMSVPSTSDLSINHAECRLWIGNLDAKLREYNLLKMVGKFGSLVEFDFLYHRSGPQAGQPRGYAFVTYNSIESAKKAQKTLDGVEVFGRRLAVKWAHAQDESKFMTKAKPPPPILSISGKESSASDTVKKMSKEGKIAALEAELKMLEERKSEPTFTPDIGGSSKPTTVIYNYIEKKQRNEPSKSQSSYKSNTLSQPYYKKSKKFK